MIRDVEWEMVMMMMRNERLRWEKRDNEKWKMVIMMRDGYDDERRETKDKR